MPITIVVGVQWGDEGKGKIVDYLSEHADLVVRFQGGNNAGHTVVVSGKKTALKLLPSGVLQPNVRCLLASGVVVDPFFIIQEIDGLQEQGIDVSPVRLGLAGEIQLLLPYHRAIDVAREDKRAADKIGTTGRGIGPAYEDFVCRTGIRLVDLFNLKNLRDLVEKNVSEKNLFLRSVVGSREQFEAGDIYDSLVKIAERIKPYVTNVSLEIADAVSAKKTILFEGAQGTLLDTNHGTYPFVTSSNTISSAACVSAGIGPTYVDKVLGVCKAYCTRVGGGPFPTEDLGVDGETLRKRGVEFGTVTGRPRRCGWFDVVAVCRAVRLNGLTSLIITKLDVLSGFKKIKLGLGYKLNGKSIIDLPVSVYDVAQLEVVYEELSGWEEDISKVRSFDQLPVNARALIERIEILTKCNVDGVSVGPERSQMILRQGTIPDLL